MRMSQATFTGLMLIVGLFVSNLQSAHAVLTLEYDFRTNQNASYAALGVPTGGTLGGSASVTTGTALGPSTIPGYNVSPKLMDGFMTISNRGTTSPFVTGDYMTTGATYTQIFNSTANNFGSGTFVAVVRPNFSNPNIRHWFMTHGPAGGASNIASLTEGAVRSVGGRATENSFGLNNPSAGNFPWVNGDWFMVAMSWEQSSGADAGSPTCCGNAGLPDGKLRSYVRPLTIGGEVTLDTPIYFTSDDAVRLWHTRFATDPLNNILTLGNRRGFGTGELTEGALGDYALFQFYDNIFELQDFNGLYSTFIVPVPEPSSLALSLLGCLALMRAGKKRCRDSLHKTTCLVVDQRSIYPPQ